jgi:hypothetical protein
MKMSIGVYLHKTQFTVCCLSEDRRVQESGTCPATDHDCRTFIMKMSSWDEEGYEVTAAVESTGNTSTFATSL